MNTKSIGFVCFLCLLLGFIPTYKAYLFVQDHSGSEKFPIHSDTLWKIGPLLPGETFIDGVLPNSSQPQILNHVVHSIPVNVIHLESGRYSSVVPSPDDPLGVKVGLTNGDFDVFPIARNVSSALSGHFVAPLIAGIGTDKMLHRPSLPIKPAIPVIETFPQILLTRNFLDALVIGRYFRLSDNIHGLDDVVVRSC